MAGMFDDLIPGGGAAPGASAQGMFDDLVPTGQPPADPRYPYSAENPPHQLDDFIADRKTINGREYLLHKKGMIYDDQMKVTVDPTVLEAFGKTRPTRLAQRMAQDNTETRILDYPVEFGRAVSKSAVEGVGNTLRGVAVLTADKPQKVADIEAGLQRLLDMTPEDATQFVASIPEAMDINPLAAFNYQRGARAMWRGDRAAAERYMAYARDAIDTTPLENKALYKAGESVNQAVQDMGPSPQFKDSLTAGLGQGIGSTATLMLPGLIPGVGPMAVAASGAAQTSANQYDTGQQELQAVRDGRAPNSYLLGLSDQDAQDLIVRSAKLGALPGASENVPIEMLVEQTAKRIPGLRAIADTPIFKRFSKATGRVVVQATAEGGQEYGQQVAQNIVNQLMLNPDQKWDEGALQSALIGALTGGVMQGATETYSAIRGEAEPGAPQTTNKSDKKDRQPPPARTEPGRLFGDLIPEPDPQAQMADDIDVLMQSGLTAEQIADMNDEEIRAESATARQQGYTPSPTVNAQPEAATPPATRSTPAKIETADDVTRAGEIVNTAPTEAQAKAGNYQMAHIRLHGMDISIENPKGSVRRGKGADGTAWESPPMPAHYGRIKGVRGADGDLLDVYIGDNPASDRVFVIDQIDPKTGKFDEHKSVMGANTIEDALSLYLDSFDGGREKNIPRVGNVTEMSVDQFTAWAPSADLSKPAGRRLLKHDKPAPMAPRVAPAQPPAPAAEVAPPSPRWTGREPLSEEHRAAMDAFLSGGKSVTQENVAAAVGGDQAAAARIIQEAISTGRVIQTRTGKLTRRKTYKKPITVLPFIASIGGIRDDGGELASRDLTGKTMTYLGPLVNKNGRSWEDVRQALVEAGYIDRPANADAQDTSSIDDVLALIDREWSGTRVYSSFDADAAEQIEAERRNERVDPDAQPEESRLDWLSENTKTGRANKRIVDVATEFGIALSRFEVELAAEQVAAGRSVDDAIEWAVINSEDILREEALLWPEVERLLRNGDEDAVAFVQAAPPRDWNATGEQDATGKDAQDSPPAPQETGEQDQGPGQEAGTSGGGGEAGRPGETGGQAEIATVEAGADGKPQTIIPGAESVSEDAAKKAAADKARKEIEVRRKQSKLRKTGQESVEDQDGGLFGGAGPRQSSILDAPQDRKPADDDNLDDILGAAIDAEFGPTEKPKTVGQAASSAVKNAAMSLDQAGAGLMKLFGNKNKLSSGFTWDQDDYEQAKPYFQAALRSLRAAGNDLKAMAAALVRYMRSIGMDRDGVEAMTPYMKQYLRDLQAGKERLDDDAPGGSDILEPDSGEPAAGHGVGAGDVPASAGRIESGAGSRGNAPRESGRGGRSDSGGVPQGGTVAVGENGNIELPAREPGADGGDAADLQPVGSTDDGSERLPDDGISALEAVKAAAAATNLDERVARQRKAEGVRVDRANIENIRQTLPVLFPEQQDDVQKVEERFAKPDGHGMMLTNGTGTGKTLSALGVVKRFAKEGKNNILIVAPSQGILLDWVRTAKWLGLDISILPDTVSNGSGIVATTYANLGENKTLADRPWDMVVTDESHKLSSAADGSPTKSMEALRAISLHPEGMWRRGEMVFRREWDAAQALKPPAKGGTEAQREKYSEAYEKWRDKVVAARPEWEAQPRSKVLMMSATPFAYHFSLDYAEGYLFKYPEARQRGGYNQPDSRDLFYIQNLGYRMRTGKLTAPEAAVNSEVMERQVNEMLKRDGSLAGRALAVDRDYDRKFLVAMSGIGGQIESALDWLKFKDDARYAWLWDQVMKKFDYLSQMRLLESIKAQAAIPYIRKSVAMGRKVVVFHNYNEGGGFSPFSFKFDPSDEVQVTQYVKQANGSFGPEVVKFKPAEIYKDFLANNPSVEKMDFAKYPAPIVALTREFPDALVYNGTVSVKARDEAKRRFNSDGPDGRNIIIVQSDAGEAGISLHDTTGKHQRVLLNLGMPVRPVTAIQQEGRIYRVGQLSDALFRYMTTGLKWERWAFASRVAVRSSTADNLGMGNQARALRQSFIDAFNAADDYEPNPQEGTGGKAIDKALDNTLTEFEKAKTHYFAQAKNARKRDQREGVDYFATPEPLGLKMVEWADIKDGDKVLEPSAGHGAIARYFPETTQRTIVEKSEELASRAALVSPGARVVNAPFESLDLVNKYDAIVMNPPFGSGGKMAIDHLDKAVRHLRNGGRVVALIPTGPAADAKFDKWYDAAENVYMVGNISLPAVAFERAGTAVMTRVVILEKQTDKDVRPQEQRERDYTSAQKIGDLFDAIENVDMGRRTPPKTPDIEIPTSGEITVGDVPFKLWGEGSAYYAELTQFVRDKFGMLARNAEAEKGHYSKVMKSFVFETAEAREAFLNRVRKGEDPKPQEMEAPATAPGEPSAAFDLAEFKHSKTGETVYVATYKSRLSNERYAALAALVKRYGGHYSSFRGSGAIPGFHFKTAEARDHLLRGVTMSGFAEEDFSLDGWWSITKGVHDNYKPLNEFTANGPRIGQHARDYILRQGRKRGGEVIVIFDGNGRVVADGGGAQTTVGWPVEVSRRMVDWGSNLAVHHNHPSSTSLSRADLTLLAYPGLRVVWAHGNHNWRYRASIPRALRMAVSPKNLGRAIFEAYRNVDAVIYSALSKMVFAKTITPRDAGLEHGHMVAMALHNAGLIDYFTDYQRQLTGGDVDALEKTATDVARKNASEYVPERDLDSTLRPDRDAVTVRHPADVGVLPHHVGSAATGDVPARGNDRGRKRADRQEEGPQLRLPGVEQGRQFDSVAIDRPGRAKATPEQLRALAHEVNDVATRILGHHLRTIGIHTSENWTRDNSAGYYDAVTGAIHIALQSYQDPRSTIRHETVHAMRELGLITRPEWATLVRQARSDWMQRYDIENIYRDVYAERFRATGYKLDEILIEEAVAEAFANYMQQRATAEPQSVVERILAKLRAFIERVANLAMGNGFRNASDVMAAMERGDMANRTVGSGAMRSFETGVIDEVLEARRIPPPRNPQPGTFMAPSDDRFMRVIRDTTMTLLQRIPRAARAGAISARRNLQDREVDIIRTQRAISDTNGPIPESRDVYLAASLFPGRTSQQDKDLVTDSLEPLVRDIAAAGLTVDEVDDFVWARHAMERNITIGQRYTPGDQFYEAMTNPAIVGGSGMSENDVQQIMQGFQTAGKLPALTRIGDSLIQINRDTLDRLLAGGLITQQVHNELTTRWQFYVPLQGHDAVFDPNHPDSSGSGQRYDTRTTGLSTAYGRTSRPGSPLAYSMMQARAALLRIEKNRVGKVLLRMAQSYPNQAVWEVNKVVMRKAIDPATGLVFEYFDRNSMSAENDFKVYVGGKAYHIKIYHDGLLRAVKGIGASHLGDLAAFFHRITRILSMLNTSWDPEFLFRNFIRDLQTAAINLQEERVKGLARSVIADAPAAFNGMREMLAGRTNSQWAQHAREFADAGGKVGFLDRGDIETEMRGIERLMKEAKPTTPRRAWMLLRDGAFGRLDRWNDALENTLRLAAYVNLRKNGISQAKAAYVARELTVNFNRKGEWGPVINSGWMFFNASTQGMANFAMRFVRSKRIQRIAFGIVAFAVAQDMLNRIVAGDDDDGENRYDKIPDEVKATNLIIMLPPDMARRIGAPYLKFPMAHQYALFHVIGTQIGAVTAGAKSPIEAGANAMSALVSSFNPLGSGGSFFNVVAPTLLDPGIDILGNRDFMGQEIEPRVFDDTVPHSERFRASTNPLFVGAARAINTATGGNENRPGGVDLSPTWLEHYYESIAGGVGRLVSRTMSVAGAAVRGDAQEINRIPFVRVFAGTSTESVDRTTYYDIVREVHILEKEADALDASGRSGEVRELIGGRPISAIKDAEKTLAKMRKERRTLQKVPGMSETTRRDRTRQLDARMDELMTRARKVWNEASP